jgi:hypothetical protein
MKQRSITVALGVFALLVAIPEARAEEWGAPALPPPPPEPELAPAPAPESPWVTPEEMAAGGASGALVCENALCRCEPGPSGPCETVACQCATELPETSPFLPDSALPPPTQSPAVDPELTGPDVQLAGRAAPDTDLHVPAPTAGFLMTERRVGLRLEAGYPFIDLDLLVRAHDVVQVGFGYRTLWTFTHAGYGELKFRLWRNEAAALGLSLLLRGGYTYIHLDEDDYDAEYNTRSALVAGNSGFGELLLAFTARRGRHAFDAAVGLRLGWVQHIVVDEGGYGNDLVFDSGEPGMLATVIVDAGYTVRMNRSSSFVAGLGVDVFTNSDAYRALPRARFGFVIEL